MKTTTINPSKLGGTIEAISSKSDLHRAIIAASLCEEPVKIYCNTLSEDIVATVGCLSSLMADIKAEQTEGGYTLCVAAGDARPKNPMCDCNESGTTLRLLTPVVAAIYKNVQFIGRGRLAERPMEPLLTVMKEHGVTFGADTLPFTVKGGLKSGTYSIAGDVSSQFISGLLFALPLLKKSSKIALTTKLESAPYVDMTISTLKTFGVNIEKAAAGFKIAGNQAYISPGEIYAEGDWSNSAFWLSAAAIGGEITVTGLKYPDTLQGDMAIVEILRSFGADISVKKENGATSITAKKGKLKGIAVDISQCPDLAPVLAVVAASAEGETVLAGAGRLKLKESDRLSATAELINLLGGSAKAQEDNIVITGGGLTGGRINSHNDHRLAMAAAVAACVANEPIVIDDSNAVAKSYPQFYSDFKMLGGIVDVL